MRLAIYGSRRQEPYIDILAEFLRLLGERGVDVVMHAKLYSYLLHLIPVSMACVRRVTDTCDFTADAAVSIGGDGTFLRTAMWVADKKIPVVGVNTGHLGYLSALSVDELPSLLGLLDSADALYAEPRGLLEVVSPGLSTRPYALNEVAITKGDKSSMITARTLIDGVPLADYRADGLLVATPTGSTAYNLSVGGPIVQPSAPVIVLSPIAAHSLSMRPLVISDRSELSVTVGLRGNYFRVSLDGRSVPLDAGTELRIRRAPFDVKVLQRRGHNFASTLRDKLAWAD